MAENTMKISFLLDSSSAWKSGIWWHRNEIPMRALAKRGHGINQPVIKHKMTQAEMDFPDTIIFGRTYPPAYNPIALMRDYKKLGKRVLYDMDDDFWQVAKDNPSVMVSNSLKDQYEGMIQEADAIITPSKILAKKFKKFKKPVFLCPNGIDYKVYQERPHQNEGLVIGYSGAASHWADLNIMMDALIDLSRKYDFQFNVDGMCGGGLKSEMLIYRKSLGPESPDHTYPQSVMPEQNGYIISALNFWEKLKELKGGHKPFCLPELHPEELSLCDFDIGLAPLEDNEFNRGKSCIKYYEYASVGTVTLASDVEPYRSEVNYRAKNTKKDWYKKLEKLIVDKDFRAKILKQQMEWVKKNRSLEAIGLPWELACQKPGGLPVLNQQQ